MFDVVGKRRVSMSVVLSRLSVNGSCESQSREHLSSYWDDIAISRDYAGIFTLSVLFLTGVPLNLYIIVLLIYRKFYSQPTFLLLIHLTFSDLFTCLIPLLYSITARFAGQASFGSTDYIRCHVCKIGASFILLSLLSSLNIALLSVDRLIFFKEPIRYENFITTRRIILALVIIWVLSIGLTIPPLLGYGDLAFSFFCGYIFITPFHLRRGMVYAIVSGIVLVAVAIVLAVTNVWILILALKVINKKKKMCVNPEATPETSSNDPIDSQRSVKNLHKRIWSKAVAKKQFRFLQTFGALLLVNVVSLIPAVVIVVMIIFTSNIPVWFVVFVQVFIFSKASLHPLMQILYTTELRQPLKCCKMKQHKRLQLMWEYLSSCGFYNCCTKSLWQKELERQLRKKPDCNYSSLDNNLTISNTDLSKI